MKLFQDVIEQEGIENQGVWVPFDSAGEVLIAAFGNPDHTKRRIALEKQYRRQYNVPANKSLGEKAGEEIEEEMQRRATYGTVGKGWRGEAFDFDAAEVPALRERMLQQFGQEIPPPPNVPEGGKGQLPFTEANYLWYMERSKRFRRVIFTNAASDDTFNKENLAILGKT